jgi:hypothetical protein
MSELKWQDPPPGRRLGGKVGAQRIDADVEELKANPGRWALIAESVTSPVLLSYRKRGCEVRISTVKPKPNARYDIYARWPK